MDFSDWLQMLRLVFGQTVVKSFRLSPAALTLNCSLKKSFVIRVEQIGEEVVAFVNEHSYPYRSTMLELLNDINRLYNQ